MAELLWPRSWPGAARRGGFATSHPGEAGSGGGGRHLTTLLLARAAAAPCCYSRLAQPRRERPAYYAHLKAAQKGPLAATEHTLARARRSEARGGVIDQRG